MKIALSLSFKVNSIEGDYCISLFEKFIKYTPYSFTKKYSTKPWDEKKHKKIIASSNNDDTIIVDSNNYDNFMITNTGSKHPHRSISIIQDIDKFLPLNEEIEFITTNSDFVSGYLYDENYEYIQSTQYSSNYKDRSFSELVLSSIKDTPYKINEFNEKEYDTTLNPGKRDLISYTWLIAAWKMWFGKPFFDIVPKEKILSFTDAYEIKELQNGNVFVQLFEKIEESASTGNMEKQRKWRKWLDFEKLAEKYK